MWCKLISASAALLLVLAAACADGDSAGGRGVSKEEIADAVAGFVEALVNGDAGELTAYWSATCGEPERSRQADAAAGVIQEVFTAVLGREGEYRLAIDADTLVMDVIDDSRVTVPLDQPEGVVVARFGGQPVPSAGSAALLFSEVPIDLAREDGQWRVATCKLFITEDEEEEEQEEMR